MTRRTGQVLKKEVVKEARYFVRRNATLKQTAEKFGVCESTIWHDITRKLVRMQDQRGLLRQVREQLNRNIDDRARRGGIAASMNRQERKESK